MTARSIHLGFEVGTGKPVEIPLKHLAITGQTQEAGKTTALEALITRSGLRAVTFITKRGEGSFGSARRIDPYFREQADWQFVASILEASRGEKLKFERAWIIRASKGARTLADVQRNVRKAMETAKGMSADVYLTLDAYLEAVVPQIARVRWAHAVELGAGVNAMDLTGLNVEMQHLVIKSTLDWVLEREEHTVVVIPEAWKFIPQGRGTPVKLAAEAFIRQGAGLKNFVWLDSQDIAGIEKIILKSVPLWILGVQREANEIKRTLDNIPAGIAKPSKADIATLGLGQFYACWGRHAIQTYVQPAWMREEMATQIATGKLPVDVARPIESMNTFARAFEAAGRTEEDDVTNEEATRLTRENEQLKADNADLRRRLEALEKGSHERHPSAHRSETATVRADQPSRPGPTTGGDRGPRAGAVGRKAFTAEESLDNEALYQAIKARLIEEAPGLIELTAQRPEVVVTIQRPRLSADGETLKGRILMLMTEGFFGEAKSCGQIRTGVKRIGPDANTANIGRVMDELTRLGFVTDEGSGYRVVPDAVGRVQVEELTGADR